MANENLELVIRVDTRDGIAKVEQFNRVVGGVGDNLERSSKKGSQGFDGLVLGMAKGILIAHAVRAAFQSVVEVIRQLTVESALYAARTETLAVVVDSLARVNGIEVRTARAAVEAVRARGIALEEARGSVARMIAAELDLSKAA